MFLRNVGEFSKDYTAYPRRYKSNLLSNVNFFPLFEKLASSILTMMSTVPWKMPVFSKISKNKCLINNIKKFSLYLTGNALLFRYEVRPVNGV